MRVVPASSALALAASLLACQPQPPEKQPAPLSVPTSIATIPIGNVSGKILGEPFNVLTARYIVDRRPGYEKLEIQLLAGTLSQQCDDIGAHHPTMVWLRRVGAAEPKAMTVRFGPGDQTPWQAHYELFDNGAWSGNGNAALLLELGDPAPDMKLRGDLYASFGDRTQSSVAGSFVAVYCPIQIDALVRGIDSMERPPARAKRAAQPNATPLPASSAAPAPNREPPGTAKQDVQL
jgi:hypothetical protein